MKLTKSRLKQLINEAINEEIENLKKGKKKQKLDENMSLRIIRNGKDVTAARQFQPGDEIIATFTLTGYKPTTGRSKVGTAGVGLAAKDAKFQALNRMDDQIFGRTPKSDAAKAKEAPKEQAAIKKEKAAAAKTPARGGPPVETPEEKAKADAMEKDLLYRKDAAAQQKTAPPAAKKPAAKLSNVERYRKDIKNYLRSFDIAVKEKNQAVIDNLTKDNPLMGMGTRELLDTLKKNTSEYDRDRGIRKLKTSLSRRGKDFKSRGKMVDFLLSLPIKHPARLAFRKAYRSQKK